GLIRAWNLFDLELVRVLGVLDLFLGEAQCLGERAAQKGGRPLRRDDSPDSDLSRRHGVTLSFVGDAPVRSGVSPNHRQSQAEPTPLSRTVLRSFYGLKAKRAAVHGNGLQSKQIAPPGRA